jgi:hypothetical protein
VSNSAIREASKIIPAGGTLAYVKTFLDASGAAACVVQEAWNIALRQARLPLKPEQPTPQKVKKERKARTYRADRRNARFGRLQEAA